MYRIHKEHCKLWRKTPLLKALFWLLIFVWFYYDFFQENLFQMLPGCPDYATGKQYVFSLIGLTYCWILCKSFCYIRVDFTLAASQNGVCIKQEMCHIIISLQNCSIIKKKVIQNVMFNVMFWIIFVFSWKESFWE